MSAEDARYFGIIDLFWKPGEAASCIEVNLAEGDWFKDFISAARLSRYWR